MDLNGLADLRGRVLAELSRAVVGKEGVIDDILAAFFAGCHVLLEDNPGLGKTLIARSLAKSLGLRFSRIQFTPDLLPADIVGSHVWKREESRFELAPGPIFANVILADEINRASPRTQSALLEAMQEGRATIEGETIALPEPFFVIATQNPIEYEGTFPLPEAQLDRFGVKLRLGYPSEEEEIRILAQRKGRATEEAVIETVASAAELAAAKALVETIEVSDDLLGYAVSLVRMSRDFSGVRVGASPRASLALMKLARARAALSGRAFTVPDDVKGFAGSVLEHRLVLHPDFWLRPGSGAELVRSIEAAVPVPLAPEGWRE